MLDGGDDDCITLTTVQDLAKVVGRAVEYEGEWPVVGGIKGTDLSIGKIIALGEEIRGTFIPPLVLHTPFVLQLLDWPVLTSDEPGLPFHVERLKADDLKAGVAKCSWLPTVDHPGIPREQAEALAPMLVASMTLGISAGALKVGDEWNRLLVDYQFTQAVPFLTEAWRGKP